MPDPQFDISNLDHDCRGLYLCEGENRKGEQEIGEVAHGCGCHPWTGRGSLSFIQTTPIIEVFIHSPVDTSGEFGLISHVEAIRFIQTTKVMANSLAVPVASSRGLG